MQGTILPSETTAIHISFASPSSSLLLPLSTCLFALSSIQYDKTRTVNQTLPDLEILTYFITS